MTRKRLLLAIRLYLIRGRKKREAFFRKNHIFGAMGENVTITDRRLPLYPQLISIHNNVKIASNVTFATHDITHSMLNRMPQKQTDYLETLGCIEIMDNVFIGANSTVIGGVRIGPNAIVAAGAVVTRDVPENSVVGGVPAQVLCSLDEYLFRRENKYPREMRPKNEEVSKELAAYMWEQFYAERDAES